MSSTQNALSTLCTFAFTLLACVALSGCCVPQNDAKASGACKAAESSKACSTCCQEQGANGHVYKGDGCACLGF